MALILLFETIPREGSDWVENARITGAVIVWLAVVAGASAVLLRIPLRKARGDRPAVTVGTIAARVVRYLIVDPILRSIRTAVGEAVEWTLGPLRTENTEQHAETAVRLTEVERAVLVLSERVQAVEDVLTAPPP